METVRLGGRTKLKRASDYLELTGFDHFRAWALSFQLAFVAVSAGGCAWLVTGLWSDAVYIGLLPCALVFAFSRTLRFSLRLHRDSCTFTHMFLFRAPYQDRQVALPLKLYVWGTDDWGDRGSWPIPEFCEAYLNSVGTETVKVGPAGQAQQILRVLSEEAERLRVLA